MKKTKRVEARKVFVCRACRVAGAAVDEDMCCVRCGADLDAFEESVYVLGKRLVELPRGFVVVTRKEARVVNVAVALCATGILARVDVCDYTVALRRAVAALRATKARRR